jgi:hypothetical protein
MIKPCIRVYNIVSVIVIIILNVNGIKNLLFVKFEYEI